MMNLLDNEVRFRSIFEHSGVGMALVSPQGRFLEVNLTLCHFLGYSSKELIGSTIKGITHPEDQQRSLHFYSVDEVRKQRHFNYKKRYIRKDGLTIWGYVSAVWISDPKRTTQYGVVQVQDITDSQNAQEAVSAERNFLQTVLDSILEPIKVINLNHQVLTLNRAARELAPEDPQGKEMLLCHQASKECQLPCSANNGACLMEQIRATGKPTWALMRHRLSSGDEHVFEVAATPLVDQNGHLQGIIESARDITERLQAEAQIEENEKRLEYLTHYDLLTRLPNRNLLKDRLPQTLARARRSGEKVAVLMLDLDRYKQINDSLGHAAGDLLLSETAQRIGKHVRQADTLARFGEDEFIVVLEQCPQVNHLAHFTQRLLDDLAQEMRLEGVGIHATASVGISIFPEDAEDGEGLLRCADAALYLAKGDGGHTYRFYTAGMNDQNRHRLELEGQLRQAIEEKQLVLHYQPQVDIVSGRHIGTEALVRWPHPQKGMISPGAFIPLAEETGLIEPIDLWGLEEACAWNRALQKKGVNPIPVSVNISARQFCREDLPGTVARVLQKTGLEARFLELEITESMIMRDVDGAIATMQALNGLGVSIALDDFGTGYSSLSYLRRFPIKKLKIDQSFIRDLVTDPSATAIAKSIVALAQSLHLRVIAEGVETTEQMATLKAMGCHEIQGYLFSRPLPSSDAEKVLAQDSPVC